MEGLEIDAKALLDQLIAFGTSYGIQLIGALLILIIGRIAASTLRKALVKFLNIRHIDRSVVTFVGSLAYFTVLTLAVLAALSKFGIQTTSFIAVLGAASFAVGLALQGSLANFAAGVLILIFRPFKAGDYIKAAGTEGEVREVQLFVTELATPDNVKTIVPNSAIMSGNIINVSGYDTRRIDLALGIAYGASIGQAMDIAMRVMAEDPRVLKDPAPQVVVCGWGESSVDLAARPWVHSNDYWAARFDLLHKIKEAYDEAGIEIPFPQRVVHMAPSPDAPSRPDRAA